MADTTWGSFTLVSSESKYRMIIRSFGPDKVGKNHFGLSGPGPIACQYFDPGLEGTVEKFRRQGKEIYAVRYKYDAMKTQEKAQELKEQFIADYELALTKASLIQWDETEVWELFRYAELGENKFGVATDKPTSYVKLNAEYRALIQRAYESNVNLHLIQKVKERWETVSETDRNGMSKNVGRPSGRFEPTGFKEANYIVQANIEHCWEKERGFGIKVHNCRQNMTLAGDEYWGLDWPTLGQLVFPESSEQDWL